MSLMKCVPTTNVHHVHVVLRIELVGFKHMRDLEVLAEVGQTRKKGQREVTRDLAGRCV